MEQKKKKKKAYARTASARWPKSHMSNARSTHSDTLAADFATPSHRHAPILPVFRPRSHFSPPESPESCDFPLDTPAFLLNSPAFLLNSPAFLLTSRVFWLRLPFFRPGSRLFSLDSPPASLDFRPEMSLMALISCVSGVFPPLPDRKMRHIAYAKTARTRKNNSRNIATRGRGKKKFKKMQGKTEFLEKKISAPQKKKKSTQKKKNSSRCF
jgi:hypothetical protein